MTVSCSATFHLHFVLLVEFSQTICINCFCHGGNQPNGMAGLTREARWRSLAGADEEEELMSLMWKEGSISQCCITFLSSLVHKCVPDHIQWHN